MSTERSGPHGILRYATSPGSSSFTEFLAAAAPGLLPSAPEPGVQVPHATTIVAAEFADGIVMAGDRRATMGNLISQRDIEKVYPADEYTLIAFAGVAGLGIELVRLFQVELEHFEKIEGTDLTLDGKANRLATMIRGNLGMALQGLTAVPLFAGFDPTAADPVAARKIFSYDVTGSCSVERYFHAIGSGSLFARGALKKIWQPQMSRDDIVRVSVEALYDAADDDSATGGPDITRGIYPVVMLATSSGIERVSDDELGGVVRALLADREAHPGA